MTFSQGLTEHLAAISARDVERFARTLSHAPDARVIAPDGSAIVGYEAILEAHRGWFGMEGWTFSPRVVVERAGDRLGFALLEVEYCEKGRARRFYLSVVFALEDGTWRLLYDQNTPLP